jgi:hypothetical protein
LKNAEKLPDDLSCDEDLCILSRKNQKIAIPLTLQGSKRACSEYEIWINEYPIPWSGCDAETILDKTYFQKNGATSIYVDENGLKFENARADDSRLWER